MKNIKVLGSGCNNCKNTIKLIDSTAKTLGIDIELEKIEGFEEIARYGIMSTPGVVIDGQVVHVGGVPSREKIQGWLQGK